jgi:hypothetical protein
MIETPNLDRLAAIMEARLAAAATPPKKEGGGEPAKATPKTDAVAGTPPPSASPAAADPPAVEPEPDLAARYEALKAKHDELVSGVAGVNAELAAAKQDAARKAWLAGIGAINPGHLAAIISAEGWTLGADTAGNQTMTKGDETLIVSETAVWKKIPNGLSYFVNRGVGGMGLSAPRPMEGEPFDPARMDDPEHYQAHRAEAIAYMRSKQGGNQ